MCSKRESAAGRLHPMRWRARAAARLPGYLGVYGIEPRRLVKLNGTRLEPRRVPRRCVCHGSSPSSVCAYGAKRLGDAIRKAIEAKDPKSTTHASTPQPRQKTSPVPHSEGSETGLVPYSRRRRPAGRPTPPHTRQQPVGPPTSYPRRRDFVSGPIASVTAAATSAMATMPK